jgi:hypothetical protein
MKNVLEGAQREMESSMISKFLGVNDRCARIEKLLQQLQNSVANLSKPQGGGNMDDSRLIKELQERMARAEETLIDV